MKVTASNYILSIYETGRNKVQDKCNSATFKIENSVASNNDPSVDIWVYLGNKYDIHNATFDELCEISHELYTNGEISLLDHGILTLVPKILAQESGQGNTSIYLTSADGMGRRDWIAELEAQANLQLRQGNIEGYAKRRQLAKILGQIKSQTP